MSEYLTKAPFVRAAYNACGGVPSAHEVLTQLTRMRVSADTRKVIEWCNALKLSLRQSARQSRTDDASRVHYTGAHIVLGYKDLE